MDLISRVPDFNLFDPAWKIYTLNHVRPAHYIGPNGSVKKSIVAEGCMVYGKVKNSVIFPGVYIDEGSEIEDSIVMMDTTIGKNTIIKQSIIGESAKIGSNVSMGIGENIVNKIKPTLYYSGITVVGENAEVPDNCSLGKNVVIDSYINSGEYCSLNI